MTDWGFFAASTLFFFAGNFFFIASIVSAKKQHSGAAFRNAMFGFAALLFSAALLP